MDRREPTRTHFLESGRRCRAGGRWHLGSGGTEEEGSHWPEQDKPPPLPYGVDVPIHGAELVTPALCLQAACSMGNPGGASMFRSLLPYLSKLLQYIAKVVSVTYAAYYYMLRV